MDERTKGALQIIAALVFGIISFLISPYLADNFAPLGYFGVFIFALFSSATVFLPVPSWMVVFSLARALDPLLLGIAAGIGSGIGELTSYYAGLGGNYIIGKDKLRLFDEHVKWIKEVEFLFLFIVSFLPNPFFDIAGLSAGVLRIPIWRFLAAVILGKTVRFILFAYFGFSLLSGF